MDSPPKRPWYRLHWGTVFSVIFVCMVWVRVAFEQISGISIVLDWVGSLSSFDGWPFRWVEYGGKIDSTALAVDLAVALTSLVCVAIVVERLERTHFSFRLSTALAVLTVIAVLLGFDRWDRQQTVNELDGGGNNVRVRIEEYVSIFQLYEPIHGWSWHLVLTLNFALGCTLYVIVRGSSRAVGLVIERLCRAVTRKTEPSDSLVQ